MMMMMLMIDGAHTVKVTLSTGDVDHINVLCDATQEVMTLDRLMLEVRTCVLMHRVYCMCRFEWARMTIVWSSMHKCGCMKTTHIHVLCATVPTCGNM